MITRKEIETKLSRIFWPQAVVAWLTTPNKELGGQTPNDLIDRGRGDEVLALVDKL